VGVKYYISAFPYIPYMQNLSRRKVFFKNLGGGEVQYYTSAFLMYCMYTYLLISQKIFLRGKGFWKLGGIEYYNSALMI